MDKKDVKRHRTVEPEEKVRIQNGLDLLKGFYQTVKTAKIYDANNVNFTSQFRSFFEGLSRSLELDDLTVWFVFRSINVVPRVSRSPLRSTSTELTSRSNSDCLTVAVPSRGMV